MRGGEGLRVAVIGAGNWGRNHVRTFHRLGVLSAVVESSEARRTEIREDCPGAAVTGDYAAFLCGSGCDAVVVATPAPTHYRVALAALEAGKDVLVEKPMTLCVEEAAALVAAAKKHRRVLMVGHLLLYKPAVRALAQAIRGGAIGDLRLIEMRRLKLGKVRSGENVLWSFAPHDLAVLLHLVGSAPERVQAAGLRSLQQGIEDDVHVHYHFPGRLQAHLHLSWLWPEDERKTVLVGTAGMLTYNEHDNRIWLHRKGVNTDLTVHDQGKEELTFPEGDALEAQALHFLECVEKRESPLTPGESGLEVVRLLVETDRALAKSSIVRAQGFFAHPTACIDEPVKIGEGTQIWHFSHVMAGVEMGERCKVGQNVFIARDVQVGANVKIQNNVSIYEGVILENDVFCGPSAVFTNIKTPRSAFPRNSADDYASTRVREGASIGANATIVCGSTIGRHALVGAGAVVTGDVPDHAVVYGNPARVKGWACRCGAVIGDCTAARIECAACNTCFTPPQGRAGPDAD